MKFTTKSRKKLADTISPVSSFLKIREQFSRVFLLESSDYQRKENSLSFICFDEVASFTVKEGQIFFRWRDDIEIESLEKRGYVAALESFSNSFEILGDEDACRYNGLFGYMDYESVSMIENIYVKKSAHGDRPMVYYSFFKYLLVFNHFNEELTLIENLAEGEESRLDEIEDLISNVNYASYSFEQSGEFSSKLSDNDYKKMVEKGKEHCKAGDVFQIVFSRPYQSSFKGDDFNVYRALRSINPSPYLFYFDYGDFRLFGSSPEAQIIVKDNKAQIHPIAGTLKRTGRDEKDREDAIQLLTDPKENAEHVMLVDLARNDLSRNCRLVEVKKFRDVQFFSHLIHLVSKVEGELKQAGDHIKVLCDTFPAGTLSGAPKIRAMEIINDCEKSPRGFYGGTIGYMNFNNELNMAIMIRTFLSMNNTLYCQAGAGIVIDSVPENELAEVNHKLRALMKAVEKAKTI